MTTGTIADRLQQIKASLPDTCTLVAVSKTKPNEAIQEAYDAGQRDFGENKVQELAEKAAAHPTDIRWHCIGHLQRNKVKYIAPFVHLIHAVDSLRLAQEINKRAQQHGRTINILLQVFIAREETKFGLDPEELKSLLQDPLFCELDHIRVCGVMGMATNTDDSAQVSAEFKGLQELFEHLRSKSTQYGLQPEAFRILSMGMSGDYPLAVQEGSNMVRVGSAIFGARQ